MFSFGPAISGVGSRSIMLTIPGSKTRYCDGVDRRSFLQIGGLAMGGASLADILRAEQQQGHSQSNKSIIMIILPGGPPHLDMFDMKPNAPTEIRGEFDPIDTSVPGIRITELMPRTAALMDKLTIIRSLHGGIDDHNVHINLTGWETHPQQGDSPLRQGYPTGGWPSIGSVISHLKGPAVPGMPPFVSLAPPNAESTTRASLNQPGFLGIGQAGFEPNRKKRDDITYKSGVTREQVARDGEQEAEITLRDMSLDRFGDRRALLHSFDRLRRDMDGSGVMLGLDDINRQAFSILTSGRLGDALNFKLESHQLRREYGISDAEVPAHGGPELLKQFLVARRLVQAGCRCVTLAFSVWPMDRESRGGFNWDFHSDNFNKSRLFVPMLDTGLSALIRDLDNHDLLEDTSVVVWGEFGRTPRINKQAGRDHWPNAASVLLAGGGMKTGQTIGSTNRYAEEPKDRPIHYRDVFASLYRNIGINAAHTHVTDLRGRPHPLVDGRMPIHELYS